MDKHFDLLLVNRKKSLQILGSLAVLLLAGALLIKTLAPADTLLAAALPWLLAGLALTTAYRLLARRALEPATVTLGSSALLVQRGSSRLQQLPLAAVQGCRYVVTRGAHTLLLRTPTGRLRLTTSELLAGTAQGTRFAEMARAVSQAVGARAATPSPAAAASPRPPG